MIKWLKLEYVGILFHIRANSDNSRIHMIILSICREGIVNDIQLSIIYIYIICISMEVIASSKMTVARHELKSFAYLYLHLHHLHINRSYCIIQNDGW